MQASQNDTAAPAPILAPAAGRETIEARIARCGNTAGFDYLRLGLSIAVLSFHSLDVSYGRAVPTEILLGPFRPVICMILPMFFALSGFLVCGSLFRSKSLLTFGTHRVLRLLPALSVEILLSALILGPLLTTLSLRDYFSDQQFWRYFLNMVGEIHYELPGLFTGNPRRYIVNQSLWTLPSELQCYIVLFAMAKFQLVTRRAALVVLVLAGGAIWTTHLFLFGSLRIAHENILPGRGLVLCFFAGVAIYMWRDRLPLSRSLFLASLGMSLLLLSRPELMYFSPLPAAYVTCYLGLLTPRRVPVVMDGDYSYGLYLFAFPIQQTYTLLLPEYRIWWLNIAVTLPLCFLYAYFSWNWIEKPVLARRKSITTSIQGCFGRAFSLFARSGKDESELSPSTVRTFGSEDRADLIS